MEVETAVRRRLRDDPTVNGYVVGKVFRHTLLEPIDTTSGQAIVVRRNGGWASPDPVMTQEYPVVQLLCWADPTRDGTGQILQDDAADKAWRLYRVADKLLHAKRGEKWGGELGLTVVTSARWAEPYVVSRADQHGDSQPMGDALYVLASYAMQVVH